MRKPLLQDEAFLQDVHAAPHDDAFFRLWWLGQSGFLVSWQNRYLLFDPYLSDSLSEKYAGTRLPHVRVVERVVDPRRLDFISLVTSSHGHTDHQDPVTLRALAEANPDLRVLAPKSTEKQCRERTGLTDDRLVSIDAGERFELAPFRVTAIPSAHEILDYDEQGACRYLGYVVELGPWKIYHSGDTVPHEELVSMLRPFDIDVALLPINGRSPELGVAGNLTAEEAALLGVEIGARAVIPCHYDMFEFNTADPEEFHEAAERVRLPHFILQCGQRWVSSSLA